MMHFLSDDFLFRNAILGGLAVAILCSTLGVTMVLRRLVLLSVALPQAGAAGIAFVFLATRHVHDANSSHLLPLAGSLAFTLGALALLTLAGRRGRVPAEWGIGVLLAVSTAATYLFVAMDPQGDMEMSSLLRGELLAIGDSELVVLAVVSALALLLFALFRRELLLASFDPEFARTLGRRPERADALLYALLGGAIALGVMNVGPLVVFGFLVLPALAALRVAPSLGVAFGLSVLIASISSLGGFGVALRADLPAGPTSVAVAALLWLLAAIAARLRVRSRVARGAALLLLLLALPLATGCAISDPRSQPLARGSLPELPPDRPIAVLGFRNDTGEALRIRSGNPIETLSSVLGEGSPPVTVPDALQQLAVRELARRGLPVRPLERVLAAVPEAPSGPGAAARIAREAGLSGPLLVGTLRRFTLTRSELVLVRLELQLVDSEGGQLLWSGEARRPVPVPGALTLQEVVIDAAPAIFAEAFGEE